MLILFVSQLEAIKIGEASLFLFFGRILLALYSRRH